MYALWVALDQNGPEADVSIEHLMKYSRLPRHIVERALAAVNRPR